MLSGFSGQPGSKNPVMARIFIRRPGRVSIVQPDAIWLEGQLEISGARFGCIDHGGEGFRVAHGHVGQVLAVDANIGLSHGVN